jgi:hypothetical protein
LQLASENAKASQIELETAMALSPEERAIALRNKWWDGPKQQAVDDNMVDDIVAAIKAAVDADIENSAAERAEQLKTYFAHGLAVAREEDAKRAEYVATFCNVIGRYQVEKELRELAKAIRTNQPGLIKDTVGLTEIQTAKLKIIELQTQLYELRKKYPEAVTR